MAAFSKNWLSQFPRDPDEVKQASTEVRQVVNQMLRELEKQELKTPAYKAIRKDVTELTGSRSKRRLPYSEDYNDQEQIIKIGLRFIQMRTSTPAGYYDWQRESKERFEQMFGDLSDSEIQKLAKFQKTNVYKDMVSLIPSSLLFDLYHEHGESLGNTEQLKEDFLKALRASPDDVYIELGKILSRR